MARRSIAVVVALLVVACGDDSGSMGDAAVARPEASPLDVATVDAGDEAGDVATPDATTPSDDLGAPDPVDAFVAADATGTRDAFVALDATEMRDAFEPLSDSGLPGDFLRFIPSIDGPTKARLRAIVEAGAARGLQRDVFSKIGDSITESASFGWDFGHGWIEYGRYTDTRPTLERFSRVIIDDGESLNSWSVHSLCATAGWTTADALGSSAGSPLARELDRTRGSFAIVMYGTNDMERLGEATYAANLRRIVDVLLERDTVVVLSTVPPRTDDATYARRVDPFNTRVREVAAATGALLLDYHGALASAPAFGLSDDGVHPNVAPGDPGAGDLRDAALAYGYNVRNLLWLLTVDRFARVVLDDGPPEG